MFGGLLPKNILAEKNIGRLAALYSESTSIKNVGGYTCNFQVSREPSNLAKFSTVKILWCSYSYS